MNSACKWQGSIFYFFTQKMNIIKRIFIISSVLLAMVLFFMGIYNLSFKKEDNSEKQEKLGNVAEEMGKPEKENNFSQNISKEKIYALTDEEVIAPVFDKESDKVVYYSASDGKVYSVEYFSGEKKIISGDSLDSLKDVSWSPNRKKVISKFNVDGKNTFYSYDHEKKIGKKLNDGVDIVSWSNLGDKIIYKFYDSEKKERSLRTCDPDGSNENKLAVTPFKMLNFTQIPQKTDIAFWNYPDALSETKLSRISIAGGKESVIFSGKYGADYLWSPSGDKALVSSLESKGSSKMMLGLINENGGEYQNLGIPTFASKCAWSRDGKVVYYALPGSLSEENVLPNDYQDKKIITKDTFWKLDLATGKKDRLIELSEIKESYDADKMFLSASEDRLFFVNRHDGKLYAIKI